MAGITAQVSSAACRGQVPWPSALPCHPQHPEMQADAEGQNLCPSPPVPGSVCHSLRHTGLWPGITFLAPSAGSPLGEQYCGPVLLSYHNQDPDYREHQSLLWRFSKVALFEPSPV